MLAIRDAKTLQLHANFAADRHNIYDLAISPDSKTIAAACHRSKVIKLWKLDFPNIRPADPKVVEGLIAQLGDDEAWRARVLDKKENMRASPEKWQAGKFVHPHDACFDADGNIFVVEWVKGGRVTKLVKA